MVNLTGNQRYKLKSLVKNIFSSKIAKNLFLSKSFGIDKTKWSGHIVSVSLNSCSFVKREPDNTYSVQLHSPT